MKHSSFKFPGLFLLLALYAGSSAQAQQSRVTFEYPMTIPYGETADFISETSYEGFGFSSFFATKSNLSLGISFQWIGWDEQSDRAAYEYQGATISGNESKEFNAYPLLMQGRYEFGQGTLKPYLGLGLGPAYIEQYQRVGFLSEHDYSTQGIMSPEAGLYLDMKNLSLGLGAQYLDTFTATSAAELEGLTIRLAMGVVSF
ncbi:MAG TPA: hypothetical protein VE954_22315 [Oligoflexus sp.]|uniref:hypothetical protein n=1 Tax=Oligoflexus sp. TaxID=1971216 RepID=UPI002D5ED32A|nr:hypothetical protein [Oligoflexus sp.]HYX35843.1 hypothetical protein [Oligoflexus sp.]